MKTEQAPHEKLTKKQIKETIETLLKKYLRLKEKIISDDIIHIDYYYEDVESLIFKLRNHFSPESSKIMTVSVKELSEMMEEKS